MSNITLHPGQIWQERDKRALCPHIRINALDGSDKAICVRLSMRENGWDAIGKPIRIGVKRLQQGRGWKLVQEAD